MYFTVSFYEHADHRVSAIDLYFTPGHSVLYMLITIHECVHINYDCISKCHIMASAAVCLLVVVE